MQPTHIHNIHDTHVGHWTREWDGSGIESVQGKMLPYIAKVHNGHNNNTIYNLYICTAMYAAHTTKLQRYMSRQPAAAAVCDVIWCTTMLCVCASVPRCCVYQYYGVCNTRCVCISLKSEGLNGLHIVRGHADAWVSEGARCNGAPVICGMSRGRGWWEVAFVQIHTHIHTLCGVFEVFEVFERVGEMGEGVRLGLVGWWTRVDWGGFFVFYFSIKWTASKWCAKISNRQNITIIRLVATTKPTNRKHFPFRPNI